MTPEEYLNDSRPTCLGCGKPAATVRVRFDPLLTELGYDVAFVKLCDQCARERAQEV